MWVVALSCVLFVGGEGEEVMEESGLLLVGGVVVLFWGLV